MAAKAKKTEEKKAAQFNEFSMEGDTFSYTGRIYPKKEGNGKVVSKSLVNLTLNGVKSTASPLLRVTLSPLAF